MSPDQWRGLALAYDALPRYSEEARPAWDAMAADEARQFGTLERYRVEPWRGDGQPYSCSAAMIQDVRTRRHLSVFSGGSAHPCRDAGQVFRGRAVHDIFGHAFPGNDFSPAGELAAFLAHRWMYSRAALPAVFCDNLGQTAYYYFHPVNAGKAHAARVWPEQKVAMLPRELWRGL